MANQTKENEILSEQNDLLLDEEKVKERLKKIGHWQLSPDKKTISRIFNFKNFRESIDFVDGLANFAEKTKHYPDIIIIRFSEVTIGLTSKDVGGLSEQDFALAQEADALAGWKIRLDKLLTSQRALIFFLIIFVLIILWQHFH